MFRVVLVAGLVSIFFLGYSQEFGVPEMTDLSMKSYDRDQEAEAVILSDIADSYFESTPEGLFIRFRRAVKIKILKNSGLEWAEVQIPYYQDGYGRSEIITEIQGYTHNIVSSGEIKTTKLDRKQIFNVKNNEYWSIKKFALPEVKVGSVIEYMYTHSTPFLFNLPDWSFQTTIPTVKSQYTTTMIPFYEYVYILQGNKYNLDISSETRSGNRSLANLTFKEVNYIFTMTDIPAFRDESYITSANDYVSRIDFQLSVRHFPQGGSEEIIPSWPKLSEELNKEENMGKFLRLSEKHIEKNFPDRVNMEGNTEHIISNTVDFVKQNIGWTGIYSKYASSRIKQLLSDKRGNVGDINLTLVAFLRAAGLDVDPVLVSTRGHGKPMIKYPILSSYNYVLAMVRTEDGPILVDATRRRLPNDQIPPECFNEEGYVINSSSSEEWVSLVNKMPSVARTDLKVKFNETSENIEYDVKREWTDYLAYENRRRYGREENQIRKNFSSESSYSYSALRTENFENINDPYRLYFKSATLSEKVRDKLFIAPFSNLPMNENPLKSEERNYPVDMVFPVSRSFSSVIEIPEGYKVSELPQPARITGDLAKFYYVVKEEEGSVRIEGVVTFVKSVYQPSEYKGIKQVFDVMVRKFNEKLVLEPVTD